MKSLCAGRAFSSFGFSRKAVCDTQTFFDETCHTPDCCRVIRYGVWLTYENGVKEALAR